MAKIFIDDLSDHRYEHYIKKRTNWFLKFYPADEFKKCDDDLCFNELCMVYAHRTLPSVTLIDNLNKLIDVETDLQDIYSDKGFVSECDLRNLVGTPLIKNDWCLFDTSDTKYTDASDIWMEILIEGMPSNPTFRVSIQTEED